MNLLDAGKQHRRISKELAINYKSYLSAMDMFTLMVNTGHKNTFDGWGQLNLISPCCRKYLTAILQRCGIVCNE